MKAILLAAAASTLLALPALAAPRDAQPAPSVRTAQNTSAPTARESEPMMREDAMPMPREAAPVMVRRAAPLVVGL